MSILRAEAITKQYRMGEVFVDALCGVDLAIDQGEFVAIMGPSGSGKSTLLHLFGGLDTPSGGEIYLSEQALSRLDEEELTLLRRRKIGFIFQFYNLIPTLTARENIALPLMIDGKFLFRQREKIDEMLSMVGLKERGDHRPDQLSGGQQQRVAIARAFVNHPEIVLADEPTGNLDTRAGTAILELLQRTCRDLGVTILLVTHDPRAASFAGRVVFLKDGRVENTLTNDAGEPSIGRIIAEMEKLEA
jgi:putative ABC transport system ATP-binding protein